MNRPSDSQHPAAPAKSLRTQYLTLYNLASAALWLRVFWRVVLILATGGGWHKVFAGADETVRIVQSVAILEVAHAALGKEQRQPQEQEQRLQCPIPNLTPQESSARPFSQP
jgi:hypothetical protein